MTSNVSYTIISKSYYLEQTNASLLLPHAIKKIKVYENNYFQVHNIDQCLYISYMYNTSSIENKNRSKT